ncbi:MAG: hypothetical protein IIV02_06670 [Peptococcaceae bacterium]|nr:hypothetical protein [Peptococcaceae bacterium]
MKRLVNGLIAIVSAAGFSFAWMALEGGGLMPLQSLAIGLVCGLGMIKSGYALGVID